jgi:hypothetical protein
MAVRESMIAAAQPSVPDFCSWFEADQASHLPTPPLMNPAASRCERAS